MIPSCDVAARVTSAAGSPYALLLAAAVIVTWLVTGPLFDFSDTWQLVINTATTIVTFLMVFVIQATTNRESKATQIKLDELIRAVHGARNAIIATDLIPEEDVEELQKEFEAVAKRAQAGPPAVAHDRDRPNHDEGPLGRASLAA